MSAPFPSGWSDDRFMVAYDAIYGIWLDHVILEDKLPELRLLLSEIEGTDTLLATILAERAKAQAA
jgi:hypothetical protein